MTTIPAPATATTAVATSAAPATNAAAEACGVRPGVVLDEPSAEAIVPHGTLIDFVTYASQLSTITVLSERIEVDVSQSGGDGRARLVTISVDENLWIEPHVVGDAARVAPEGTHLEFVTWGLGAGKTASTSGGFGGEPLLRVGCRYLVGLMRDGDAMIPYPGSVGVIDGGEVRFGPGGLLNMAVDGSPVATNEVVRAVGAARPDDRISGTGLTDEEFFALDAWERSMAIARSAPPIASTSLPAVDDDGSSPVITSFPSEAVEEGIVSGTLIESDGCLYVVEAGRISLLVLPAGTGWDATTSSVINADGTSASVGEAVIASGGSQTISDLTPYYLDDEYPEAERCAAAAGTDVVQIAGRLERAG